MSFALLCYSRTLISCIIYSCIFYSHFCLPFIIALLLLPFLFSLIYSTDFFLNYSSFFNLFSSFSFLVRFFLFSFLLFSFYSFRVFSAIFSFLIFHFTNSKRSFFFFLVHLVFFVLSCRFEFSAVDDSLLEFFFLTLLCIYLLYAFPELFFFVFHFLTCISNYF